MLTMPIKIPPTVEAINCSIFSFCLACGERKIITAKASATILEKMEIPEHKSKVRIAPILTASKVILIQTLNSKRLRCIKYEPSKPVVIRLPARYAETSGLFMVNVSSEKALNLP